MRLVISFGTLKRSIINQEFGIESAHGQTPKLPIVIDCPGEVYHLNSFIVIEVVGGCQCVAEINIISKTFLYYNDDNLSKVNRTNGDEGRATNLLHQS